MGTIAAIITRNKLHPTIHRRKVDKSDIKKVATVDIMEYKYARSMLRDISYCTLPVVPGQLPRQVDLYLLWKICAKQRSGPSWSESMQAIAWKAHIVPKRYVLFNSGIWKEVNPCCQHCRCNILSFHSLEYIHPSRKLSLRSAVIFIIILQSKSGRKECVVLSPTTWSPFFFWPLL